MWRRHRGRRPTHAAADRAVGGIRALNPGSTRLPRLWGKASWLPFKHNGYAGLTAEQRNVPFEVSAVISDLHRRHYPNVDFIESILTGQRLQLRTPGAS